jgi:hypothetical protein
MSFLNPKYTKLKTDKVRYITGFGATGGFISKAAFVRAYAYIKK